MFVLDLEDYISNIVDVPLILNGCVGLDVSLMTSTKGTGNSCVILQPHTCSQPSNISSPMLVVVGSIPFHPPLHMVIAWIVGCR